LEQLVEQRSCKPQVEGEFLYEKFLKFKSLPWLFLLKLYVHTLVKVIVKQKKAWTYTKD